MWYVYARAAQRSCFGPFETVQGAAQFVAEHRKPEDGWKDISIRYTRSK